MPETKNSIQDRFPVKGDKAPAFMLPAFPEEDFEFGKNNRLGTILFFYPKDNTSGCTTEAIEFTQAATKFEKLGYKLVGISPDPIKSHEKFTTKHQLGVTLVSDEELEACNAYSVWVEKSMYGRNYMGVERSTFLISASGIVEQVWRKVRIKGHVEAVLQSANEQKNL